MITCALWDIESLELDRRPFYLILGTLYPIVHTWSLSIPYLINAEVFLPEKPQSPEGIKAKDAPQIDQLCCVIPPEIVQAI